MMSTRTLVARSLLGCTRNARVVQVQISVKPMAFTMQKRFQSSPPPAHAKHATIPIADKSLPYLAERTSYVRVANRLEKETKNNITVKEFDSICAAEGVPAAQHAQLRKALSDSGIILHVESSAPKLADTIFLHANKINDKLEKLLDTHTSGEIKTELAEYEQAAEEIRRELGPFEAQKRDLEQQAHRRSQLIMWGSLGYCVVQAALVARLTWWELSWDVMEPVTYMLTFVTAIIGLTYFNLTNTEYTYEGLKKTLITRKLAKLYRSHKFDEAGYLTLHESLTHNENRIRKLKDQLRPIKFSKATPEETPATPASPVTPSTDKPINVTTPSS